MAAGPQLDALLRHGVRQVQLDEAGLAAGGQPTAVFADGDRSDAIVE